MKMENEYLSYDEIADKFKALANPVRLRLIVSLKDEECCVGDIQKCLSISQSNVSQHLRVLKEAGLIERRRDKNKVCYRLTDDSVFQLLRNYLKGEKVR